MALQKASRKPTTKSTTKPTSKRLSTTKAPRKSRSSLPSSASDSQKTLTQIHFVPRLRQPDELDPEDLEPIESGVEGKNAIRVAEVPRSTAVPRPTPGSKSTKKRKRKLEKDPRDKTLTQIGYVARYQVKDIEDEQDMERLQPDDPDATMGEESTNSEGQPLRYKSPAEPVRVPWSMIEATGSGEDGHTMSEEIEPEPTRPGTKSRSGGRPRNEDASRGEEPSKYETIAGKRSRMRREIANHLASPEEFATNGSGKRKAIYQEASGDTESDYADDESPKRTKRQRVSPDSQAPIASRLRPRRTRVSYVSNKVTKDVNSSGNQSNSKRTRKPTKIGCVSKPKTPVKKRVLEIPSSQSPAITPLSIRSRPVIRSGEMSPLRSPLTDLSAHSRMANSAKIHRAAEKVLARSSEPQNIWFRNIQPTTGSASSTNVTNENVPADQGSQQSPRSSQSSLPDLVTIFGRTQQVHKPRSSPISHDDAINGPDEPHESAINEVNEDNDNEFDIGPETQNAFDHVDRSADLPYEDDYDCGFDALEGTPLELPPGDIAITPNHRSHFEEPNPRLESTSPPWITNAKTKAQKSTQLNLELRQSQISTQGIPSSSIPFSTQREQVKQSRADAFSSSTKAKDLTQIWDSTDNSSNHENEIAVAHPDIASSPQPTPSPKPKDLTQIWDGTASEPSQPQSHPGQLNDTTTPPKTNKNVTFVTEHPSPKSTQPKTRDLTQIWDSDSSDREVLRASQLLPASLMESLPRPPGWTQSQMGMQSGTQGVESDDDWI